MAHVGYCRKSVLLSFVTREYVHCLRPRNERVWYLPVNIYLSLSADLRLTPFHRVYIRREVNKVMNCFTPQASTFQGTRSFYGCNIFKLVFIVSIIIIRFLIHKMYLAKNGTQSLSFFTVYNPNCVLPWCLQEFERGWVGEEGPALDNIFKYTRDFF